MMRRVTGPVHPIARTNQIIGQNCSAATIKTYLWKEMLEEVTRFEEEHPLQYWEAVMIQMQRHAQPIRLLGCKTGHDGWEEAWYRVIFQHVDLKAIPWDDALRYLMTRHPNIHFTEWMFEEVPQPMQAAPKPDNWPTFQ